MRINEIDARLSEIKKRLDDPNLSLEEIGKLEKEVDSLLEEKRQIKQAAETRQKTINDVLSGKGTPLNWFKSVDERGVNKMDIEKNDNRELQELETRAFQKYLTGGIKTMTDVEQRALATSGAAAVMPIHIMNQLITSEKYSDLLYRATVLNEPGAAKVYIPIASNSAASWKIENSDVDGDNNSYEKSPTLTKIELGGYELYRWMRISAATMALSTPEFERLMMDLISAEVIETLEKSFIDGTGIGQPKGLDNLTWATGTNQILTADASTPIGASHIAQALALLPQKYARGAIILVNSDTLYNTISLLQGTAEYAFDLSNGAQRFMGKEIVVSEHMADDTIYIVNPRELYVRFAAPLAVESNRSSGFTQASIDLRALTVVDAAWNQKACVRVAKGIGE